MEFVIIVILLIIVISSKKAANADKQAAYLQGRYDERTSLWRRIRQGEKDSLSVNELSTLLEQDGVADSSTTHVHPVDNQSAASLASTDSPAAKERRTLQNLNTMLYLGSFLIVAAAALFVMMTMPAAVRLAGIFGTMGVFYAAGLVLHAKSERLRSAAVAFVGTGLAIVPFIGFALTMLANVSNEASWLITSVVGVAMYLIAALRLQSELVSYVTIAFVVSLALSSVPMLDLSVVWYFIAVIAMSLIANLIRILRLEWLPQIFQKPLHDTGQIMTPIALVASVFMMQTLSIGMYELLFGLATLHYLALWGVTREVMYELVVRGLLHMTLLIIAGDVAQSFAGREGSMLFGTLWLLFATLQLLYGLMRVQLDDAKSVLRERSVAMVILASLVLTVPFWLAIIRPELWISIHLAVIAVSCVAIALRFREVPWLYGALGVSLVLPYLIGRTVIQPAVPFELLALGFTMGAAVSVVVLDQCVTSRRSESVCNFFLIAASLYACAVATSGCFAGTLMAGTWTMAVTAAILWVSSYIKKQPWTFAMGNLFLFGGWTFLWNWLEFAPDWQIYGTAWLAAAVYYLFYWLSYRSSDRQRVLVSLGSTLAVLLLPALQLWSSDTMLVVASAITTLGIASVVAIHGVLYKRLAYVEAGVYIATIGLQRMVGAVLPELDTLVYTHWWAITLIAAALWRKEYQQRMRLGLACITVPTGLFALAEGGGYTLVFLIEHMIMALSGAVLGRQWVMWWGIGAVLVAILYFLRDYTVVMLLFLGLTLILFVVWRLLRREK